MPQLSPEELARILKKLEDVSRQAEELRREIHQKMVDQARSQSTELGRTPVRGILPKRKARKQT